MTLRFAPDPNAGRFINDHRRHQHPIPNVVFIAADLSSSPVITLQQQPLGEKDDTA